jgi:hypothetical protein
VVVQLLVNVVLTNGVLDIVGFFLVFPLFVQLVDLTSCGVEEEEGTP